MLAQFPLTAHGYSRALVPHKTDALFAFPQIFDPIQGQKILTVLGLITTHWSNSGVR